MSEQRKKLKDWYDTEFAKMLSGKLVSVFTDFDVKAFVAAYEKGHQNFELKGRVKYLADLLYNHLPFDIYRSLDILSRILGDENPNETGMFTEFYWLMPVASYVEVYGQQAPEASLHFIEELTKRHTGEFAIRPFITNHTDITLQHINRWAISKNFHLRRLAVEGLRPRLPWASKLTLFINNPEPVFSVIEKMKDERVMFVKKSVGNLLNDYLKENEEPTMALLNKWYDTNNADTLWIIKHALRNKTKKSGLTLDKIMGIN